jgi:hypothetical protein
MRFDANCEQTSARSALRFCSPARNFKFYGVTEWDAPNALIIARNLAGFLLVFAPLAALIFYRWKRREIQRAS